MLTKQQLEQFDRDGFIVLENFFSTDQCNKLMHEADKIINNIAKETNEFEGVPSYPYITKDQTPSQNDLNYLENSAGGVKLFINSREIKEIKSGQATTSKNQPRRARANALGHALHAVNPVFKELTLSKQVVDVVKTLGLRKPVVCQGIYFMMQQPDTEKGNQTGTYVIVEPSKLLTFWVAVTDCTKNDGCFEVIPGSHKQGLLSKFVRNPNSVDWEKGNRFVYAGKMQYPNEGYVSIPLKAGSVLLTDGALIHRMTKSEDSHPHDLYAFHIFDSDVSTFSKQNWMPTDKAIFLPLY